MKLIDKQVVNKHFYLIWFKIHGYYDEVKITNENCIPKYAVPAHIEDAKYENNFQKITWVVKVNPFKFIVGILLHFSCYWQAITQ